MSDQSLIPISFSFAVIVQLVKGAGAR